MITLAAQPPPSPQAAFIAALAAAMERGASPAEALLMASGCTSTNELLAFLRGLGGSRE